MWLAEYNDITGKRVLWDLVKYEIRQEAMKYGKQKARERKAKLYFLENQLKIADNWKSKYEAALRGLLYYDNKQSGTRKDNIYFLNLESNKNRGAMENILTKVKT